MIDGRFYRSLLHLHTLMWLPRHMNIFRYIDALWEYSGYSRLICSKRRSSRRLCRCRCLHESGPIFSGTFPASPGLLIARFPRPAALSWIQTDSGDRPSPSPWFESRFQFDQRREALWSVVLQCKKPRSRNYFLRSGDGFSYTFYL